MDLVVQASERAGLDPRVGRAAREWIEEADESGLGDFDYSAVVAQVRGASASLD
jgi:3-hydroxyisobutyrate dehydrogenase-like beta-hydroxyacid dehydrogenase